MGCRSGQTDSIEAFTNYLQLYAEKVRFTKSITFYSLRCNTAQKLLDKVRPKQTRAIMAHDPNSTIPERCYTANRMGLLNLTSIAVGEDGARPDHVRDMLAVTELGQDQLQMIAPILNELFEQLRNSDPFPWTLSLLSTTRQLLHGSRRAHKR